MKGNNKLTTFINMYKSNEFLEIYLNKIINKKCKSIKFIDDFNYKSLELLYISLEMFNNNIEFNKDIYNKLDKKELKYHFNKLEGINYFKKQVPKLSKEEYIISYIIHATTKGLYELDNDNVIFANGLTLEINWLVEFIKYLIVSFRNINNLSNNKLTYTIYTLDINNSSTNINEFLKNINLYEYTITKSNHGEITYYDLIFLEELFMNISKYDFNLLKEINSKLSKNKFILSITKKKPNFTKIEKNNIKNLYNENSPILEDYLEDILNSNNSKIKLNKKELTNNYELLLDLASSYKYHYSLEHIRKLMNIEDLKKLKNALIISNFYIVYIYDQENLNKDFNYEILKLDNLKPNTIDYETEEYKKILKKLSSLQKQNVSLNRKIVNNKISGNSYETLKEITNEISNLRNRINLIKDENRETYNMNKAKINYIALSLSSGNFNINNDTFIFNTYDKKDLHRTFNLEINNKDFIEIVLSDYNCNLRINYYF